MWWRVHSCCCHAKPMEDPKSSVFRHDLARGLIRVPGELLGDCPQTYGPLFCIPFEMTDKTSMDNMAQKALWAVSCVMSYVERGDSSGFIDCLYGFRCVKSRDEKDKWIIVKERHQEEASMRHRISFLEDDTGSVRSGASFEDELKKIMFRKASIDAESSNIFKEMEIFIRIHEARSVVDAVDEEEDYNVDMEHCEHFLVVMVRCPLAFSFRSAVYESLQNNKQRGGDSQFVDVRRGVWNMLANHMREGLYGGQDEVGKPCYSQKAISKSTEVSNIDWMRISNEDSFSCLFSVQRCVDWISKKFFLKHCDDDLDSFYLEGFGLIRKDKMCLSPSVISDYVQFDLDVDKALARKGEKERKAKRQKRGPKKGPKLSFVEAAEANVMVLKSPSPPEEDDPNSNERCLVAVPCGFPVQLTISETKVKHIVYGYPPCALCMQVVLPTQVECIESFHQFEGHIKSFPASVTLGILRKTLVLEEDSSAWSTQQGKTVALKSLQGKEEALTLTDIRGVVCGKDFGMGRAMLSGGDSSLARHCEESIASLTDDQRKFRYQMMKSFVRLSFALSLTRSMGSDGYTNERVSCYGRFIENTSGNLSKKECAETYEECVEWRKKAGGGACPDLTHEAAMFLGQVIHNCNERKWDLRPDNVFYMTHLMVSDMMLCLNYHGSVIGGAANGIGATIVVRDGGGNYRRWFRDPSSSDSGPSLGQIFSKRYGSGADMVIGMYKIVIDIGLYDERFRVKESFISELKRTTEMGLMQDCCNVTESHGNDRRQVHTVVDTMARKYSTELKAGNDAQSQSCMQAIAWLIPRNTTAMDLNVFKTTREHEKTKARVYVEYRQVTYGYWVICSNHVGLQSRERFRTIVTVSRSVASSASALPKAGLKQDIVLGWTGCESKMNTENLKRINGLPDQSAASNTSSYDLLLAKEGRPLFFSSMCTSVLTGFMQWTGSLGKLPSSQVTEALLSVFYVQLEMNKDILNPDMFNAGEKARCYQISKARGVAFSLLCTGMQETVDAGRRGQGHQEAVEKCSLHLMTQSISPSVAPYIMGDTLEHMLRLDFLILMQLFCIKFEVPDQGIALEDVLGWLASGSANHCEALRKWLEVYKKRIIRVASFDHRSKGNGLTNIEYCMYITHDAGLTCSVPEMTAGDMDAVVLNHVGTMLYRQFSQMLSNYCQIVEAQGGEEIMRGMLAVCCNKQFQWPSVFGTSDDLDHFWMGHRPKDDQKEIAKTLCLAPIRSIVLDVRKASICVDIRWLLLCRCLAGGIPSQSSRYAFVGRWIQYFYKSCVPEYMITSKELFCGMPSPYMHGGFICPSVVSPKVSKRCMLRRPCIHICLNDSLPILGLDAPIGSKVVEDLGPAAERYQLSVILGVPERDLPTDCVNGYRLPLNVWFPVLAVAEEERIFASLKVIVDDHSHAYVYLLCLEDVVYNVSSDANDEFKDIYWKDKKLLSCCSGDDSDEYSFLSGRVMVEVRPLCVFFRPGVLLRIVPPNEYDDCEQCAVIIKYEYERGAYKVLSRCGAEIFMNAYEVEDAVQPFKAVVYAQIAGLCLVDVKQNVAFYDEDGSEVGEEGVDGDDLLQVELCIPREDLQHDYEESNYTGNGFVSVIINVLNKTASSDGDVAGSQKRNFYMIANVHVQYLTFFTHRKRVFLAVALK